MILTIDQFSLKRLEDQQPNLSLHYKNSKLVEISGIMQFAFNHITGEYSSWSSSSESGFINCTFKVKITNIDTVPNVFETGGTIAKYASKKDILLIDLHNGKDGYCCLFPRNQWPLISKNKINLKDFIVKRVYSYFYSIEYFMHNNVRPFGEYSHGISGYLDAFNEEKPDNQKIIKNSTLLSLKNRLSKINYEKLENNIKIKKRRLSGCNKCICGSKKLLKNCHIKQVRRFLKNIINL